MQSSKSSLGALTLGAIGVVYGDIGTSVLYAVKEVFGSGHVAFTPDNVYGILSIFFWTLTVIVSLKYVTLVLRADNQLLVNFSFSHSSGEMMEMVPTRRIEPNAASIAIAGAPSTALSSARRHRLIKKVQ